MVVKAADRLIDRLLEVIDETPVERAVSMLSSLAEGPLSVSAHAQVLRLLTHLDFSEEEARQILGAALRHREALREKLGRDVGTRVALFDLLVSVDRRLTNPKIIEIQAFERIERSAITDHLTGLFNRMYFDSRLRLEIRRARRFGQHLSLLLLDLDDFKSVNDLKGHPAGDAVLKEIGRLLVGRIRDIDIGARYGGEEFATLLPETPRSGAFVVAERIRREVERHFRRKGRLDRLVRVTLSGGLACFPEDADDPESLIICADKALYKAKRAGKNAIATYFEEKRKAERVDLEDSGVSAILQMPVREGAVRRRARVKNLSEGGILLELREPVPVGSELKVSFSLGVRRDFTLPSTVVRVAEFESNGKRRRFEAGLRFQKRVKNLEAQLHRLARQHAAAI